METSSSSGDRGPPDTPGFGLVATGEEEEGDPTAFSPSSTSSSLAESHDPSLEPYGTQPEVTRSVIDTLTYNTCKLIKDFTTRTIDEDFMREILAPDFKANIDSFPVAADASTHINNLRIQGEEHPQWTLEVLNSTAAFSDRKRKATVWVTLSVKGLPVTGFEQVARESVSAVRWRRVPGGCWICTRWKTVRGPGPTR
jgi:hypothetical protein